MSLFSTLPVFTTVVELGSFSAASNKLGINKSAVSKKISALETQLGVKLIQRTTRKLSLTEAGEQYYSYIQQAHTLIQDAEDAVTSLQGCAKGHLKISMPMVFGQMHIVPLLAEFLAQYPDIKLTIAMDDQHVDVVKAGLDMVIRIGALTDSSLIAKKLAPCHSVLCASPAYFKRCGTPQTLSELKQHNCLFYSYFKAGTEWTFNGPNGTERIKPTGNVQINNSEALTQLMLDGVGIAQMPLFLVEDKLANGELVPCLDAYQLPEHGIYALYPQRQFMPEKLKVFLDYLSQKITQSSDRW